MQGGYGGAQTFARSSRRLYRNRWCGMYRLGWTASGGRVLAARRQGPLGAQPDAVAVIRVQIISAIRLYREAIAEVLQHRSGFLVVGTAGTLGEALRNLRHCELDVVLLDVITPNALVVSRAIREANPKIEIIALTVPDAEAEILACTEAGVSGYVSREGSIEDLVGGIVSAMRGELNCSAQLAKSLARRLAVLAAMRPANPDLSALTRRELQIAELIDHGSSNKQIARALGIEVSTVKNHVHNILEKLHVHRRGEAAARLRQYFFTDTPPSEPLSAE